MISVYASFLTADFFILYTMKTVSNANATEIIRVTAKEIPNAARTPIALSPLSFVDDS